VRFSSRSEPRSSFSTRSIRAVRWGARARLALCGRCRRGPGRLYRHDTDLTRVGGVARCAEGLDRVAYTKWRRGDGTPGVAAVLHGLLEAPEGRFSSKCVVCSPRGGDRR